MKRRINRVRQTAKGGALAAALFFMIVVTTAGIALLGSSTRNQIAIIERSVDVRLMVSVEAAVETVRGRFKLVQGVQDDWNWLSTSAWTTLDVVTVNGIPVTLQAKSIGGPSVPTAEIRGFATAGGITRWVGYDIKVASFSDYAMFQNSSGATHYGTNLKQVGNYYTNGDMYCSNPGIQLFGKTEVVGNFYPNLTYYPGGGNDPVLCPYTPVNTSPALVPMPSASAQWDYLETVAQSSSTFFAENTIEIEFQGANFIRRYIRRRNTAAANDWTRPTGGGWINTANGATNWSHSSLNNTHYELVSETLPIPNEGVIYVDSGAANTISSTFDCIGGAPGQNRWTQSFGYSGTGSQSFRDNNSQTLSSASNAGNYIQALLVHGVIDNRRCSLVCNHNVIVRDDLAYQSLIDNPELRRFEGDGTLRESDAALNMGEMLGVMSKEDVVLTPIWWESTAYNANDYGLGAYIPGVPDIVGELIPDHFDTQTSSTDAVLFALGNCKPHHYNSPRGSNEWWLHGGLIGGESVASGLGSHFGRRNYYWDFRMAFTMPPYFLRAYNVTAKFIPGTWRSWQT